MVSKTGEQILDVAERIFLRQGFHHVPMDALARELGMSKKTLYAHFSSKEELLRAVLTRRVARIGRALEEMVAVKQPFHERFRIMIHFIHGKMTEISPLFIEDIRRHAPESFRIIDEYRARAIPLYFGRLIDDGLQSGCLRTDLQRDVLVRMLVLSIQGIMRPEIIGTLNLAPAQALDAILSVIFQGVLTPKGRKVCEKFLTS